MNNNLCLERFLFPCPEINDRAYPAIPTKIWNGLERAVLCAQTQIQYILHPYATRTNAGEYYFEIHVSRTSDMDHLKRFIIRKDYRLTEEQEEEFYRLCHDDHVIVDWELYRLMEHVIMRSFPEIQFIHYKDRRLGLLHLYFALHRSGPRELLYKARLPVFAAKLDEIDNYNYVGRTPSEIFDGIPMKLLRILQCEWGVEFLTDCESRKLLAHFYKMHAGNIQDWDLSPEQYQYILSCAKHEVEFHKKCLQFIEGLDTPSFEDYLEYLKHRSRIQPYYDCPLSGSEGDMLLHMETANEIWYELEHREELDAMLKTNYRYNKCLETELDGLFVRIPQTVEEFLKEGKALKSCIGTYAKRVAEKKTLLAFVRRVSEPDKPYLALELSMGAVRQAKGFLNRSLSAEEDNWLKAYCKKKCIQPALLEYEDDDFYLPNLDDDLLRALEELLLELEVTL